MDVAISYSEARQHLKREMDRISRDHEIALIIRKNGENMILLSESDFRSIQETAYLSQSPYNLQRLLESLQRTGGKSLEEVKDELGI